MSYHRFIGGPHDGEWHDVRRLQGLFLPPTWTIAERPEVKLHLEPISVADAGFIRQTSYVMLPLHIGKDQDEAVTFYIESGMKPRDALLRLAECYRPNPEVSGK